MDSARAWPAKLAGEADPPLRRPRHADSPSSRSDGPRAHKARVLLPQKSSRAATISDVSSTSTRRTRSGTWGGLLILAGLLLSGVGSSARAREGAADRPLVEASSAAGALQTSSDARPPALIMLLTDYGAKGYQLGALKGAIYRSDPLARVDSLTHDIARFDIAEAAQTLVLAAPEFPAGTVFLVAVDPSLGRPRRAIALETRNGQRYVAPDNGVLTQVALRFGIARIHEISSPLIVRVAPEQSTSLSRDILSPAAAALAQGLGLERLGPAQEELFLMTDPPAEIRGKEIAGRVSLVDEFGNVHTNVLRSHLEQLEIGPDAELEVVVRKKKHRVKQGRRYSDVPSGEAIALLGAHGDIRLAINQGHLADAWAVQKGDEVIVRRAP